MQDFIFFKKSVIGAVACASLILQPITAWAAEFNPHLIISDNDLTATESMTAQGIQDFFTAQKSGLATIKFIDTDGVSRSAAEIIFSASREEHISPRYLLVVLQKEQSLVTTTNPTQRQLDWATGYGVCDSCSMEDPAIQKFRGFATQVRRSAGIMRYYYDNLQSTWIKRLGQAYLIDNITVTPQSNATGFLYTYTPHVSGNKNFWRIWNQWFTKFFPDGAIVKVAGENTVYLIQAGKIRPFMSKAAYLSRYNQNEIITVEPTDIVSYQKGVPITLPNYSLVQAPSGMLFLLIDTAKHPIASQAVLKSIGYNPGEIEDISEEELETYSNSTFITSASIYPLGAVVQEKKSKQLYYIKNGIRYIIPSMDVVKNVFPSKKIITLNLAQISKFDFDPTKVISFKDGTLLKIKGSREVYVTSNGQLRLIPNETIFKNLGYNKKNIIETSEQTLTHFTMGEPLIDVVGKTQIASRS